MRRFERGGGYSEDTAKVREVTPMVDPQYELRECGRCFEGRVYESSVPTGRWVTCGACKGAGKRSVYLYPKKGRRS